MYFSDPEHNVAQFGIHIGDHVADLGTGAGHYALALAKAVEISGKVYAVDIQKDLLKELAVRAHEVGVPNILAIAADIEKSHGTGLEDESVDAALTANALFQVEEKFAFLKEAFRILKKGGRILVIDWKGSFRGIGPPEKYIFSEDSLQDLMEEIGFTFIRTIDAGEYHYGLIFKK